jgi:hypothetical protein
MGGASGKNQGAAVNSAARGFTMLQAGEKALCARAIIPLSSALAEFSLNAALFQFGYKIVLKPIKHTNNKPAGIDSLLIFA